MQTVSERSAWIRRGWEDQRKGWPWRDDIPEQWREWYALGRRRAGDDRASEDLDGRREQG